MSQDNSSRFCRFRSKLWKRFVTGYSADREQQISGKITGAAWGFCRKTRFPDFFARKPLKFPETAKNIFVKIWKILGAPQKFLNDFSDDDPRKLGCGASFGVIPNFYLEALPPEGEGGLRVSGRSA